MRTIRTILVLTLIFAFVLGGPVRAFAASKPLYVSDVMVGMGETAEEAKKALTDAGYTVLDVNLNEGAGSALKTEKFVYLGYKTTADPDEAVTDLAVMNMNGGYSFSDYAALMEKYRDSQIRPFIDNFIATVKEYRGNYNSANEANKAKADFAYAVLSHVIEDYTGSNMGDLLLNPTKEELGLTDDQYKALPAEKKSETADLTTAIMQGNTQVVFLIEQTLALAADTNETTWLERLSELGPDGLEAKYAEAGVRSAEAKREMAALYNDTARIILKGWEALRTELLDFEVDQARSAGEEGAPEIDEFLHYDFENGEDESETEISAQNAEKIVSDAADLIEEAAENTENVVSSRTALIYCALKDIPYGDGTMFDLFTKPYSEVSGANASALYPMVSTLTAGQTAAADFLPLQLLLQIGVAENDSYEAFSSGNSDLLECIENAGEVSLYLDVNREIFSERTALTSEMLRKSASSGFGWTQPNSDILGLSKFTALSWGVTAISAAVAIRSAVQFSKAAAAAATFKKTTDGVTKMYKALAGSKYISPHNLRLVVEKTAGPNGKEALKATLSYADYSGKGSETAFFPADSPLATGTEKLDARLNHFNDQQNTLNNTANFWNRYRTATGVVFAVLAVISIGLTVYDLYRYYNVSYMPIPKYIVDEADITALDEDGNRIVVRNDAAYYTVAQTNRPKTHKQYKALQDCADLNGDAGKEWLALYSVKLPGGEPILADSFKVVTGSTSMPEGYAKGIHMFGSNAAANLTDSRYTYNDNLNGIYVYYLTENAAPAQAASAFSGGALALVGTGGAAIGAALGAIAVMMIGKKKKTAAAS